MHVAGKCSIRFKENITLANATMYRESIGVVGNYTRFGLTDRVSGERTQETKFNTGQVRYNFGGSDFSLGVILMEDLREWLEIEKYI